MKPFIPIDFNLTHVVGCSAHFLGPAVVVLVTDEGKTLTARECRKVMDYMIVEGFLTEEHKAWLIQNNKRIIPIVTDSEGHICELDERSGWEYYLPKNT